MSKFLRITNTSNTCASWNPNWSIALSTLFSYQCLVYHVIVDHYFLTDKNLLLWESGSPDCLAWYAPDIKQKGNSRMLNCIYPGIILHFLSKIIGDFKIKSDAIFYVTISRILLFLSLIHILHRKCYFWVKLLKLWI